MRVLFDTSAIIPALAESHSHHARTFPWLEGVQKKEIDGVVSAHTLAELYGYLSGPGKKSPRDVKAVIEQDILSIMQVVALTEAEYVAMVAHCSVLDIRGGTIYDAIHAHVAIKANVDILLTINKKDFYRVYPELIPKIVVPTETDYINGR